jgi:beta-glucanase (GH16 family)
VCVVREGRRSDRVRTAFVLSFAYGLVLALVAVLLVARQDTMRMGADGVVNGSAANDISGWKASSDAGPIRVTRVSISDGPGNSRSAVDIRRRDVNGKWSIALATLREPESFFEVGRSYQMLVYVRDMNASGKSVELALANDNYEHKPTPLRAYENFNDGSWRVLVTTFVCIEPASPDTALYLALPPAGPLHLQVTGASVREVAPVGPPRVKSSPTRVLSFGGPAGTSPNEEVWNYEVGGHGWGHDELQTYTARLSNAQLDGRGRLVLTARREDATGPDGIRRGYTSGRLTTQGKVELQPRTYIEAPIRVPVGEGVWPAFWLIGSNFPEVGWPASGELDIVEVWDDPSIIYSHLHMALASYPRRDAPYGGRVGAGWTDLGHPADFRFHRYGVYFDEYVVQFYIDRKRTLTFTAADADATGRTWPFDSPHYIVLNVAIGGIGDPSQTQFPKRMTVGEIAIWEGGVPF